MSCYKMLQTEINDLRQQLFMARIEIQGLKDALATTPEWVSTREVLHHLDSIPLDPPFAD